MPGILIAGGDVLASIFGAGEAAAGAGAALGEGALAGAVGAGAAGAGAAGTAALDLGALGAAGVGGAEAAGATAPTDLSVLGATGDATIPANATFTSGAGITLPGTTSPGLDALSGGATGGLDTGAVTAAAPGAGAAAPGGGTFLDKLSADPLGTLIGKNPLGAVVAGGGLALNLLKGNQQPQGTAGLQQEVGDLASQSAQLRSYLSSGTLPPGLQASVSAATQAAKASIISNYASRGMSTDPTQNSALAQELAQVDQTAIITTAQIGEQLMSQGITEAQLTEQIYNSLVKIDQTQQQQITQSIASFAAALGGGVGTKTPAGSFTFTPA